MEIPALGNNCTFPGGDPPPTPCAFTVQPSLTRFAVFSFLSPKCFRWDAEGPCWPGGAGFSHYLRGISWLGGSGGGGGWCRAPTATRALSTSSGSRGDEGGGGSSSPDDKHTAARLARGSSIGDKLAAARAKREPAQGKGVGDTAAGGAARGSPRGWGGYAASPRGGGSGGGGGRSGGGGGAGVKRKAPFAERASAERNQLNGELSRAGSVEEILTLVDERADVFNAINVSTALNKLWSGLMDSARHIMGCKLMVSARHVIGCSLAQETSVQNAFDDAASTYCIRP